jgi:hypothetical protein
MLAERGLPPNREFVIWPCHWAGRRDVPAMARRRAARGGAFVLRPTAGRCGADGEREKGKKARQPHGVHTSVPLFMPASASPALTGLLQVSVDQQVELVRRQGHGFGCVCGRGKRAKVEEMKTLAVAGPGRPRVQGVCGGVRARWWGVRWATRAALVCSAVRTLSLWTLSRPSKQKARVPGTQSPSPGAPPTDLPLPKTKKEKEFLSFAPH